jgi:hypothetical protein
MFVLLHTERLHVISGQMSDRDNFRVFYVCLANNSIESDIITTLYKHCCGRAMVYIHNVYRASTVRH